MIDAFHIETREKAAGMEILQARGRLEAEGARLLRDECVRARDVDRTLHVVVQLSDVTFISSSGIGCLLVLAEDFRTNGGSFVVAEPSEAVAAVISLLNLDQLLTLTDTVEAAKELSKATI